MRSLTARTETFIAIRGDAELLATSAMVWAHLDVNAVLWHERHGAPIREEREWDQRGRHRRLVSAKQRFIDELFSRYKCVLHGHMAPVQAS